VTRHSAHFEIVKERIQSIASARALQGGSGGSSVRYSIKKKEWTGIFIEPVGFLFQRLKQNYEYSERFIFENVAIGTKKGRRKFYYVSEDAKAKLGDDLPHCYDKLGSFDRDHILRHLDGSLEPYIVEEEIQCVPMQEIFDKNDVKKIDLLHIDTEGFDYKILSQINFKRYKPLVVLYEHKHLSADEKEKANSLLKTSGYSLFEYGGDTLAIFKG
jgi:FkbM family methyltransferase